jgi:hypothetical protein
VTRITAAIIASLLLLTGAHEASAQNAGSKARPSLNVGIERFAWEEFTGGQRLLKEGGMRFAVGLKTDTFDRPSSGTIYGFEGRLYFGQVDYDGQTQSVITAYDGLPLRSDTLYVGGLGEALVGQRFGGQQGVDLLAGVGVNNWVREIEASQTMSGGTIVYTGNAVEQYFILYTKFGIGLYRRGTNRYGHLQIGAKYPFYTYEYVDDIDLALYPTEDWSGYAQLRIGSAKPGDARFDITVYYDSFRFGQSPAEPFTRNGTAYIAFQPESHMDVVGLTVGLYF